VGILEGERLAGTSKEVSNMATKDSLWSQELEHGRHINNIREQEEDEDINNSTQTGNNRHNHIISKILGRKGIKLKYHINKVLALARMAFPMAILPVSQWDNARVPRANRTAIKLSFQLRSARVSKVSIMDINRKYPSVLDFPHKSTGILLKCLCNKVHPMVIRPAVAVANSNILLAYKVSLMDTNPKYLCSKVMATPTAIAHMFHHNEMGYIEQDRFNHKPGLKAKPTGSQADRALQFELLNRASSHNKPAIREVNNSTDHKPAYRLKGLSIRARPLIPVLVLEVDSREHMAIPAQVLPATESLLNLSKSI